jgi:polyvinyl alcohol dehydrogenase (cytochrome)
VASTPTVSNVALGTATSVLFVGGGDGQFYALDARTGILLWSTRLGSSPSNFIWSSPAVFNGSVYIGLASYGDCPLVQGQLIQLSATSGTVQHVFDVVPTGCTGGGVWSSPTIDTVTKTVYFATGNPGTCASAEAQSESLVEVHASDLSLVGWWSVPIAERGGDSDFGATPTLFSFKNARKVHRMVGLVNKNGTYYAFARDELARGPRWRAKVADGGSAPQDGSADVSPSAWDGSTLYVAAGTATINGVSCPGIVNAIDPSSGRFKWQQCLPDGPVIGAVAAVRGVVTVGEGNRIMVLADSTGRTLFSYVTAASVWGAGSISNGVLYQGDIGGTLYALGL